MDDREDGSALPSQVVHDAIVADQDLANGLAAELGNDTAELGMSAKSFDRVQDPLYLECGVRRRIRGNVLKGVAQIVPGA